VHSPAPRSVRAGARKANSYQFPNEPTIPYNLACYTCQLGRRAEAEGWLARAFALGNSKEIKLQAMDDPDLAPLWVTKN